MENVYSKIFQEYDYIDDDFVILKGFNQKPPVQEHPKRMEMGVFGICLQGSSQIEINLNTYTLEKNTVIIVYPGDIVSGRKMSDDFNAIFIAISSTFLDGVTGPLPVQFPVLLHLKKHPLIKITGHDVANLQSYYDFIRAQFRNTSNAFRKETIRCLLRAMLTQLWSIFLEHIPVTNIPQKDRKSELTEQFFAKLQRNYKEERSVNFYADSLYVTPKHLSTVVKSVTGRTTSEWIDDYVILEAKAVLKNSRHSVQRIALDLNFSDQSFFAKFFKKHAGMSPTAYRATS